MNKRDKYLLKQEEIKWRAIYKILQSQQKRFINMLESKDQKLFVIKSINDDINNFVDDTSWEIPDYLTVSLKPVMRQGGQETIHDLASYLPIDYWISFNNPTDLSEQYFNQLKSVNISWGMSDTTKNELRGIVSQWIANWKSYTQIAKDINATNPFVFGKSRAKLIAVNEVWRAYWYGSYIPALELQKDWYNVLKYWHTRHDQIVRPEHTQNEADWWITLDKNFSWTQDEYAPSYNTINCRCFWTYEVV